MTNSNIIKNLEVILANSYALALKTQNYHWNVCGQNFKSLHELFGEQYEEIFTAIDDLAERIRALGKKVDGTFDFFKNNSKIINGEFTKNANDMVKELAQDNRLIANDLRESVKIAQQENDEATADMLIARIESHEKAAWMLESSL